MDDPNGSSRYSYSHREENRHDNRRRDRERVGNDDRYSQRQRSERSSHSVSHSHRDHDQDGQRRGRDQIGSRTREDRGGRRRSRSRSRSRDRERRHHSSHKKRHNDSYHDSDWRVDEDKNNTDDNYGNSNYNELNYEEDHAGRDLRNQTPVDGEVAGYSFASSMNNKDWRLKLTNIRDAHFNRSKVAPTIGQQNQFTNDGSFLEQFKKMAGATSENSTNVMPNSLALASSSIQFDSEISLPPLTTSTFDSKPSTSVEEQDLDGVPIKKSTIPAPVSISVGRRRMAKPLKTGVVFKKKPDGDEDEASQEKLDAWAKYLKEVQRYKSANCVEDDDPSRPLVK